MAGGDQAKGGSRPRRVHHWTNTGRYVPGLQGNYGTAVDLAAKALRFTTHKELGSNIGATEGSARAYRRGQRNAPGPILDRLNEQLRELIAGATKALEAIERAKNKSRG